MKVADKTLAVSPCFKFKWDDKNTALKIHLKHSEGQSAVCFIIKKGY